MQLKWWQIMSPELSMFKFRLPWEEGKTSYPAGDIYAQVYQGPTSSETRLIVKKNAAIREYDNVQYEDACYYHNTVIKEKKYACKLGNLNLSRDTLDNCYDCASFVYIMEQYITVMGLKMTGLRQLIKDVQFEISFGKSNIYSKTVKYFTESFDKFKRFCYIQCGNKKCKICASGMKPSDPISKGFSRATIENEKKAMEKVGALDDYNYGAAKKDGRDVDEKDVAKKDVDEKDDKDALKTKSRSPAKSPVKSPAKTKSSIKSKPKTKPKSKSPNKRPRSPTKKRITLKKSNR